VTLRTATSSLLCLVLGLPLGHLLLMWVAGLLSAMGDAEAAYVIERVNLGVGVLWLVSLVGLVVILGLKAANERVRQADESDEPPL